MQPTIRLEELAVVDGALESCLILSQVDDAFNQADDGWDISPTEQDVNDASNDLAGVELVDSEAAKQDAEHTSGGLRLHRGVTLPVVRRILCLRRSLACSWNRGSARSTEASSCNDLVAAI